MVDLLSALIRITVMISALIIPILILRLPVRLLTGPVIACRMWFILLLSAGAIIPPPWTASYIGPFLEGLGPTVIGTAAAIWLGGVVLSLALLVGAHLRVLDKARKGEVGPAVIGLFNPRVYLPHGFEETYSTAEQSVMRIHERVHLLRGDATANAMMALVQCLFWFNPLVHLAATRLRRDQEMACDAAVMDVRPEQRRLYAETMLKTQVARMTEMPMGCAFTGVHPLEERIAALARRMPSSFSQVIGSLLLMVGAAWIIEVAISSYISLGPLWVPGWA